MSKKKIESLLGLFADYRTFCDHTQQANSTPLINGCELSENELEFVAAATLTPPPLKKKDRNQK